MTFPHTTTATIHQAFFSFRERGDGLGMVAASFPIDSDRAEATRLALAPHARLSSYDGAPPPDKALSYFVLPGGDDAVVMRRVREGDSPGRNNSHALIGPASVLTPDVALRLRRWPQWKIHSPVGEWLDLLGWPGLGGAEPAAEDDLSFRPERIRDALVKAIVWDLVADHQRPLYVINCGSDDRIAFLRGLLHILAALGVPADRRTFSTYEVKSTGAQPRIILFPGPVEEQYIDLTEDQAAGRPEIARAERLVDQYLSGRSVVDEPVEVRRELDPDRTRAVRVGHDQDTTVFGPSGSAADRPRVSSSPVSGGHPYGPTPPLPTVRQQPSHSTIRELVLTAANGLPAELRDVLDRLRTVVGTQSDRQVLLDALSRADWLTGVVQKQSSQYPAWEALARLVFGNDLAELRTYQGHQTLVRLRSDAPALAAAVQRLDSQHQPSDVSPVNPARTSGWPGQQEPGTMWPGQVVHLTPAIRRALLASAAVLVLMLVSFVVGRSTAGSDAPEAAVVTVTAPAAPPVGGETQVPSRPAVVVELVGTASADLRLDVEFTGELPGELWLLSRRDAAGAVHYLSSRQCQPVEADATCEAAPPEGGWRAADDLVLVVASPEAADALRAGVPEVALPAGADVLFRYRGIPGAQR